MRLKYYMRGIGVGIILTALILSIANPKEKLSDEEIIRRASALGMTMKEETNSDLSKLLNDIKPSDVTPQPITPEPDISPVISPEPSITPATQQPATDNSNSADNSTSNDSATSVDNSTSADNSVPARDLTPAPTETVTEASDEITFTIQRGMSSGKVAKLLKDKGLIDDADDFNTYIIRQGKASSINIGTYTLPKGASYKEIVSAIAK